MRVGAKGSEEVEILSGLSPGEQVVVLGPSNLKDGDEVAAR